MKRTFLVPILGTIMLILGTQCDSPPNITGPTPPPPPPIDEPQDPEPQDPPFNPGSTFGFSGTRGILLFPGTQATRASITSLHNRAKMAGWPRITWHVCAETVEWEGTPWYDFQVNGGPDDVYTQENLDNLTSFLNTTADLGDQVILDVFCTVRDNQAWLRRGNLEKWSQTVGEIAAPYQHVAIHVANEPWHPASAFRDVSYLRRARDTMRRAGFMGHIGADDNASRPGDHRYSSDYRNLGFWPDFHPWRESQGQDLIPTREELEDIRSKNSFGTVVISEPIAYSPWLGGGCCTDRKQLITRYMQRTESLRMMFIYHSTSGLEDPNKPFDWLPGEN